MTTREELVRMYAYMTTKALREREEWLSIAYAMDSAADVLDRLMMVRVELKRRGKTPSPKPTKVKFRQLQIGQHFWVGAQEFVKISNLCLNKGKNARFVFPNGSEHAMIGFPLDSPCWLDKEKQW